MKKIASLLLMLCSTLAFAADQQSQLRLYVFEGNTPVTDYSVWMDQGTKHTANEDGASLFNFSAGKHQFSVSRTGYEMVTLNLDVAEGEYLQVILTQQKGNPVSHVAIETSKEEKQGPQFSDEKKQVGEPGTIKGRLLSSEDNKPVANARIYFTGVAQEFVSDKDGYFTATVGASDYSISIIHPRFATQTVDGITVVAKQTTEKQFDLSPSGIALKEFVVVAPFIQGSVASLTDERKESSVMADFVGTEQMARSGDSDAASALTRVSGLTLIDGKYVVMRGMEDRYSTVLMNGSAVPSTDPSKAAVPLDLFPASILDSIEVQKTYSADLPGAFGGGAVKLRTKKLPEEDNFSIKLSLGGNTEVTGKDVIDHKGGSTDYLGMDDGSRDIPAGVPTHAYIQPTTTFNQSEYTPEEGEVFAESFAKNYSTTQSTAQNDFGASINFAKLFSAGEYKYGFMGYTAYKNKWRYREVEKNTYTASDSGTSLKDYYDAEQTKYSVDLDGMFSASIKNDKNSLQYNGFLARKSYRLTDYEYGYQAEGGYETRDYKLEWSERQLLTHQFLGEHTLTDWLKGNWRITSSEATLDTPDRRTYSYDARSGSDTVPYGITDGETNREFLNMTDSTLDMGFSLDADIFKTENFAGKLKFGMDMVQTDRDSQLIRYEYTYAQKNNIPEDIRVNQNPDEVYSDANIGPNAFGMANNTNPADGYTADQSIAANYLIFDLDMWEHLNVVLGMRNETYEQNVHTFELLSSVDNPEPIDISQSSTDSMPSLLATLKVWDNFQIRLAMAETVNRPTFLELSSSSFLDPDTGKNMRGNPNLVSAKITHTDLRFELYGEGSDSVSLAFFAKDFTNPIERTLEVSSETVVTFDNAVSASNSGYEVDFRKDLPVLFNGFDMGISGNYSSITSSVVLPEGNTESSQKRAMQGQSPYTINLMLSMDYEPYAIKSALIYNEIGERIVQVGKNALPSVYEQPFKSLDMTFNKEISDTFSMGFKLKNLLDEEVLYTQDGKVYMRYKEGISYSFDMGMKF